MASMVRNVVGNAILTKLNDPRISPMTSVTRVAMTPDLQIARVYVSVMGSEAEVSRTLAGLRHASGRLQRIVAGALKARHCPELVLEIDDSLKKAARLSALIDASLGESIRETGEDMEDIAVLDEPEATPGREFDAESAAEMVGHSPSDVRNRRESDLDGAQE
jgi:ribosome-binding factor A